MNMFVVMVLARMHLLAVTADCSAGTGKITCETGLPKVGAGNGEIQQILKIVFGVIAALAVLMIVIAGFRFVIAQGSPQEVTKARNTILYALIGLVVALAAEAIVALVLGKV